MRIIAGDLRGRAIRAPEGAATRPTSDRARQAVFNILEHATWSEGIEGLRVIDVFAGSGAMGLEALSRGAAACLFVENAAAALSAIRANLDAFGLEGRGQILRQDATKLSPLAAVEAPCDLAFLDPPYKKELGAPALQALRAGGWLAPASVAVIEVGADEPDMAPPGFEVLDNRRYGAAKVLFLRPA